MWSAPSSALLRGPLRPRVIVPVRIRFMGEKDLFNYLTVCKLNWIISVI